MDKYELEILTMFFLTNKTLHKAQLSNKYRLNAMTDLNNQSRLKLEKISVSSLEDSLQAIRNEIYNSLILCREYVDFLGNIKAINLYDAAEIIVEIGDIGRFKTRKQFISYAGLAPVEKKGDKVYKIKKYSKGHRVANKKYDNIDYCENLKVCLTKCTQKIINSDDKYKALYDEKFEYYHLKYPMYSKKRIHLMALKKATIRFANKIYSEFKKIKSIEDYEKIKYNIANDDSV